VAADAELQAVAICPRRGFKSAGACGRIQRISDGFFTCFRPLGDDAGLVVEQHLQLEIADHRRRTGALLDAGAPGRILPALYAAGTKDKRTALWRSDDSGRSWSRINDDQHQWGLRFRAITGDPRIFGRVYVATDGRGILYGDPR